MSSVALTFFAFLGFGVVTFTAKDLADPARQLPRALYLALGIATVIYVAVALGVFGTLTVQEVIDSGGTALAVAAEPVLGRAGYWMMTVTALFATAGATNSGLYPAGGLCEQMTSIGQFPPLLGRRLGGRLPSGLLVTAVVAAILAVGFDLSSIASLGSVIALVVFALVTVGHLRVRAETGAHLPVLLLALASTVIVLVTFVFTTLVDEPATAVLLVVILVISVGLDLGWKRVRNGRPSIDPAPAIDGSIATTDLDRPSDSVSRLPVPPLEPHWVIVDGLPVFHRICLDAGPTADAIVHVHGFGISGTYLEPTAALLAARHRSFVPDLPGMGQEHAATPTARPPGSRAGPHGLLRCRRGRTGDVGRQLAGLPDHPRGRDRVPRPHHPRRPGLAGRRAQQPANCQGAPADGR